MDGDADDASVAKSAGSGNVEKSSASEESDTSSSSEPRSDFKEVVMFKLIQL